MLPVDALPATIQSVTDARPGPTVDGAPLRPGDVLVAPGGDRRVVTETGLGVANDAVGLFDPDERCSIPPGRGTRNDAGRWRVVWRSLGTVTRLGDDGRERLLLTAGFDPVRDQFAWAWGRGPVAALDVSLQPLASADTVTALRQALEAPFSKRVEPLLSAFGADRPELIDRLRAQVATSAERRADALGRDESDLPLDGTTATETVGTGPSLSTTGVEIPTGERPPVELREGDPFRPGDRLVYWDEDPPASPLSAGRDALAAGHCQVILRQSPGTGADAGVRCYDVANGDRTAIPASEFGAMGRRATEAGLVCRLLARDCFVDPIGTEQTYSLHVYALDGATDERFLLAGSRRETTTPRLEHPLVLSTTPYDGVDALLAALSGAKPLAHPLARWADRHESVAELRTRLVDRIEERDRSLSGFEG